MIYLLWRHHWSVAEIKVQVQPEGGSSLSDWKSWDFKIRSLSMPSISWCQDHMFLLQWVVRRCSSKIGVLKIFEKESVNVTASDIKKVFIFSTFCYDYFFVWNMCLKSKFHFFQMEIEKKAFTREMCHSHN